MTDHITPEHPWRYAVTAPDPDALRLRWIEHEAEPEENPVYYEEPDTLDWYDR
ncbi:hypothetical protein [Corynebacterium qintianiae]|uniref:hypothetical protein n=1 Tax=Corynebacterium qintianiae TaxID=2709392 RepID=UPI0013EBBD64|nr:hypothetical protein [Corynebacterium qintianiae]